MVDLCTNNQMVAPMKGDNLTFVRIVGRQHTVDEGRRQQRGTAVCATLLSIMDFSLGMNTKRTIYHPRVPDK